MPTINLLYKKEYPINDKIRIIIPTVGEVLNDEDTYYGAVSMLTAMPIDMMVQLDDAGVDFADINEYELFLMLFNALKETDTRLIFGDLNLKKFRLAQNNDNGTIVLIDQENDIVIDRAIHGRIADTLRRINHLEKNIRKPGNDAAKKYMIERARVKQKRAMKKKTESQLESLIVAIVNTEQFKYGFDGTRELSIYQFNESVRQIIKKIEYDNRMYGVYSGAISAKDLSQEDLNWLTHK